MKPNPNPAYVQRGKQQDYNISYKIKRWQYLKHKPVNTLINEKGKMATNWPLSLYIWYLMVTVKISLSNNLMTTHAKYWSFHLLAIINHSENKQMTAFNKKYN
jgi:hypothetical protein